LISLIIVGAIAFYLGKASNIQPITVKLLTPSVTPTVPANTPPPTGVVTPTVPLKTDNTKVYTSTVKAFELAYPESWKFQGKGEGCGPVWFPTASDSAWITICGPAVNPDETPENLAKQELGSDQALVNSEVTVDGHKGIRVEVQKNVPNYHYQVTTYIGSVNSEYPVQYPNASPAIEKKTGTLMIYMYVLNQALLPDMMNAYTKVLENINVSD
jgi:hypothetical protein